MDLIDASTETGAQGHTLFRTYLIAGRVVRVEVRCAKPQDSYAVADVLNNHLDWTQLVVQPVPTWHETATYSKRPVAHLERVAGNLADRAATVLQAALAATLTAEQEQS